MSKPVNTILSAMDVVKNAISERERQLAEALAPLIAIADAYDMNELDDEGRKFYYPRGVETRTTRPSPDKIELYTGRGGRRLLTLEHCLAARRAVRGTPDSLVAEKYQKQGETFGDAICRINASAEKILTYEGVPIDQIKQIRLTEPHGRYPAGHVLGVVKIIPHGGNYDCESQFLVDDGSYVPSNKAEPYDGTL